MKKKITMISLVFIGFFLAVTANSWAQRERGGDRSGDDRGGQFQKWDKPAVQKFNHNSDRAYQPKRNPQHYRPVQRFYPKFHKRQPYRVPPRFRPNFRLWRHRPVYRHGHPRPFMWRHSHSVVKEINNYYSSAESYAAAQDEFQASASVSDSGFAVSVGVSKTN
ncbi:MAG: hypothetical protein ACWGNO_01790 [Desulfobacterales bacterium]